MIKYLDIKDLDECAEIMIAVYNNEVWQCHWTKDRAINYLQDFFEHKRFLGYGLWQKNKLIGAIFCHTKLWWDNNEVFIDEMFLLPQFQNKGYGSMLIEKVESYIKEEKLAGLTLITNKYSFAPKFYSKIGFQEAEHISFMYKVIGE